MRRGYLVAVTRSGNYTQITCVFYTGRQCETAVKKISEDLATNLPRNYHEDPANCYEIATTFHVLDFAKIALRGFNGTDLHVREGVTAELWERSICLSTWILTWRKQSVCCRFIFAMFAEKKNCCDYAKINTQIPINYFKCIFLHEEAEFLF